MRLRAENEKKVFGLSFLILMISVCILSVVRPVTAEAAGVKNITIRVGEKYTQSISGAPATLRWSSSNRSVVKILAVRGTRNRSAVLYGVKPGKAVITARAGNSSLRANVTVKAAKAVKITANANYKKAPKMKQAGTYYVTAKKNNSVVRFVAPSSGTWKITISNIRHYGKSSSKCDSIGVLYPFNSNLDLITVKTNGGREYCLYTATKYTYNHYFKRVGKKVDNYLATRSLWVNLKKGKSLYLQYNYAANNGKCQYTLQVQK